MFTIEISHGTLHINGNVVSRTLDDQKVSHPRLYSAPRGVFRDYRISSADLRLNVWPILSRDLCPKK